jgi:hypothetical protein
MRRWVLWGGLVPLGFVFILWAMNWEPVYWVVMPFVYRETTLAPERTIGNIAYDASAPLDPKRQLDSKLALSLSNVVCVDVVLIAKDQEPVRHDRIGIGRQSADLRQAKASVLAIAGG